MSSGSGSLEELSGMLDKYYPHLKDILMENGSIRVPHVSNRYLFVNRVGEGRFGFVSMGQDRTTGDLAAVKTVKPRQDQQVGPSDSNQNNLS